MLGDTAPKRFRLAVDGLAAMTVISLFLVSWLFYDRITTSRQTQADTRAAIRTVLCFAQSQVEADSAVTAKQRRRAVRFYTEALKKIDEPPCSSARRPSR